MRGMLALFGVKSVATSAKLILAIAFCMFVSHTTQSQTFKVIHRFTGGQDGGNPFAGLTIDAAGNLYGTTYGGGLGYGIVFKLQKAGSGWIFSSLHSFRGGNDGANPKAPVIIGTDGSLYGTTQAGGGSCFCGTVFKLIGRPIHSMAPWPEVVLYRFTGYADGYAPSEGLVSDQAGNLYGTTISGGPENVGTAYELIPISTGWTFKLIHIFQVFNDGENPYGNLIVDSSGNLYGTTVYGGSYYDGTVYELSPSGSIWTISLLYNFQNGIDGGHPSSGVIIDNSGNLYGATADNIFELVHSGGNWVYTVLYNLGGDGPTEGGLVMDRTRSIYGTTYLGGAHRAGSIFKLTPLNDGWTYTDLHDFDLADGEQPVGNIIIDSTGNLYGTASNGGGYNGGSVWEITP